MKKRRSIGRRRQQAIAAKAELRRRVEQEEKNSKMNRLKIQNQWRKIMRLAKVIADGVNIGTWKECGAGG